MADNGAWFGLIGALGGALIGGLAAMYGPLLLHRRQAAATVRTQQAQRDEQGLARLLALRSTGREWFDLLERATQDLAAGRTVDIDRFDDAVARVSRDTTEAGYGLAHSGIWMESDSPATGRPAAGEATVPEPGPAADPDPTAPARSLLLGRLRTATREVRAQALARTQGSDHPLAAGVLAAMSEVRSARAHLNAAILEQIERHHDSPARRL